VHSRGIVKGNKIKLEEGGRSTGKIVVGGKKKNMDRKKVGSKRWLMSMMLAK